MSQSGQSNSEENAMETETYDVRVRLEETADLYVGERARAAMQADAMRQLEDRQAKAEVLAEDLDMTDVEACKALRFELSLAHQAANALVALAPLADEPEDDE